MTATFLTPLVATKLAEPSGMGRPQWRLAEPLRYSSDELRAVVEVPAGFVTDFASVPRVPLAFWLFGDTAQASAVVHDYLVGVLDWDQAADVFREAMLAEGVPAWRAGLMYRAVLWFGRPREPVTGPQLPHGDV